MVFHDLITSQIDQTNVSSIATPLVFHSVFGKKYINHKPETDWGVDGSFPNIGAIIVDESLRSKDSIMNVAGVLQCPWYYMPDDDQLNAYRKVYEQYYDKELLYLYDNAIQMNRSRFKKDNLTSRLFLAAKALYRGKV